MDTNDFFNRRKFVGGAAISTAATALTARAYSQVAGKPMALQLAEEEANNRSSLAWMHQKFT